MAKNTLNSAAQKRVRTKVKTTRIKEAGLDSRRVGRVSASGQRAQARRDAKQ